MLYTIYGLVEEVKNDDQEINVLKWWHVNKSGFPVAASTWDRMWLYIRHVHPEGEQVEKMIRGQLQQKVLYNQCMVTVILLLPS